MRTNPTAWVLAADRSVLLLRPELRYDHALSRLAIVHGGCGELMDSTEENVMQKMDTRRGGRLATLMVAGALALQLTTGAVMAADPVQARKDLKAMGVEYTEQEFAKVAGNGDMPAVQLFLDAGMSVSAGGSAALGVAAGRGQTKMVQFLLAKGAKPTSNSLQFARTRGHKDIEKMLVDAGAKE